MPGMCQCSCTLFVFNPDACLDCPLTLSEEEDGAELPEVPAVGGAPGVVLEFEPEDFFATEKDFEDLSVTYLSRTEEILKYIFGDDEDDEDAEDEDTDLSHGCVGCGACDKDDDEDN